MTPAEAREKLIDVIRSQKRHDGLAPSSADLADAILAAGYVRPAPTQGDRDIARQIVGDYWCDDVRGDMSIDERDEKLEARIATALAARAAPLEAVARGAKKALDLMTERATAAEAALTTAREDAFKRAEEIARGIWMERDAHPQSLLATHGEQIAAAIAAERTGGTK